MTEKERMTESQQAENPKLHVPVMEMEVLQVFREQISPLRKIIDGTLGRGGHSLSLLKTFPSLQIIGFDRDGEAIQYIQEKFQSFLAGGRLKIIRADFRSLGEQNLGLCDGALFDLGVSSPQFDQPHRGFSFSHEGPLDMRMDQRQERTAASLVNELSYDELCDLFQTLGEVKRPHRVVRAIVHDRDTESFNTTRQLASLIERVERAGGRKGNRRIHPATGYFMALRIAVNEELEGLGAFIESLPQHLNPGSRVVFITFHSLEDRIVKWAFKKMDPEKGKVLTKKVIIPQETEIERNPRARSAKLRVFEMGENK